MSQFKNARAVLCRTRDFSVLSKAYLANPSYLRYWDKGFKYDSYSSNDNQHLYIISDDEIKRGDWVFDYHCNNTFKINERYDEGQIEELNRISAIKKIIATSDKTIHIPQIPEEFIEQYVEEYNKDNFIFDVLVEYDEYLSRYFDSGKGHRESNNEKRIPSGVFYVRVNSDNTITIKI